MRGRGAQTRRRLLDAATVVFARRGYHAARVDDIVKVANTSHGTFYLYFENKEALFAALAAEVTERTNELVDELPDLEPTPASLAALTDWLTRFGAHDQESGPVLRAWTEADLKGDQQRTFDTTISLRLIDAIAARIAANIDRAIDPRVGAVAIVAMIERANYYTSNQQLDVDADILAATLARIAQAAIFTPT